MKKFRRCSQRKIAKARRDRATKLFKSIFEEYLHEKQKEYPTNAVELAAILKLFYAEARKQNCKLYSRRACSVLLGLGWIDISRKFFLLLSFNCFKNIVARNERFIIFALNVYLFHWCCSLLLVFEYIIKQLLDSVFKWYRELSRTRFVLSTEAFGG